MKIVYKATFIGTLVVMSVNGIYAQEESAKKEPAILISGLYTGDIVSNFSGGIKKGTVYLGLVNLKGDFNTEIANWWKGGEVFVNIGNTHGGEPSANLVGDFQGISNIEAGNHTFLYELWYKQNFKNLNITIGLQDLNANFATCDNSALFSNSSFGIHSSIADNVSPPIFPLTALGANIKWNISETFLWETAIFDGTPDDFNKNPYNTKWSLSKDQGYLTITEFQLKKSLLNGKDGCYKLGGYFHQHNDSIDVLQKNDGFYFVGDQQVSSKLSVFCQIGLSPKKKNKNNRYCGVGINCKSLFDKRHDDQFGLAVAYAGIDGNSVGSETAVELTYKLQLNRNIYLRPDIQYIINPVGTEAKLNNALVGFIRFGLGF